MAFVTAEEVAVRLGWPLTPEEEDKVNALIEDCIVSVEEYCGKDFEYREDESFQLPPVSGCFLKIPRRYLPFLQIDQIEMGGEVLDDWVLQDQAVGLYRPDGWDQVVTVTGSWGYQPVPAIVKKVVLTEVIRGMSQTPGVSMERTGEREVEYDTGSSPQSLSTAACWELRRYRTSATTLTLKRGGLL